MCWHLLRVWDHRFPLISTTEGVAPEERTEVTPTDQVESGHPRKVTLPVYEPSHELHGIRLESLLAAELTSRRKCTSVFQLKTHLKTVPTDQNILEPLEAVQIKQNIVRSSIISCFESRNQKSFRNGIMPNDANFRVIVAEKEIYLFV